jgi:Ribbon-helix-helix protein, copG family
MSRSEILSVRIDPDLVRRLRRLADDRDVTLSELLRSAALERVQQEALKETAKKRLTPVQREVAGLIDRLRYQRDMLPTVTGYRIDCGNFGCNEGGGFGHEHCGEPADMWSDAAWDLELAARALEQQWGMAA